MQAEAASTSDHSVSELLESSARIVEGKVTKVEGVCQHENCWTIATIQIDAEYKKSAALKNTGELLFCVDVPLRLRNSYIAFLVKRKDIGCEFAALPDGVFERINSGIYRYMSPDSLQMVELQGNEFWTAWRRDVEIERVLSETNGSKGTEWSAPVSTDR